MDQPHIIELAQWLDTPAGQYMQHWQQMQFDSMVANVFGYHAMQIGLPGWDCLRTSRIRYRGRTAIGHQERLEPGVSLIAAPEQLPFASQSIDLLVLPHTLECSVNPHQVLREAERVLMPEGRVVISGFNPWSLWGLRDRLPGVPPLLPVPADMQVSLVRLKDWFKLLSFELDRGRFGCYAPWASSRRWLERWSFMEAAGDRWWPVCGAVYVVSAVKRVAGKRLVGKIWEAVPARAGSQVAAGRGAVHQKGRSSL